MKPHKWRIRKWHGVWNVYRPGEDFPCEVYPTFAAMLLWWPEDHR